MSAGSDTKANTRGGALERRERRHRGQQLAQHDRSRLADALTLQVELRDAVLAQGVERDPAEVGHNRVLEHRRGQILRSVARNVVVADAVTPGHRAIVREAHRAGLGRRDQRGGQPQSIRFLVSGC